jgi:hypothetical protein
MRFTWFTGRSSPSQSPVRILAASLALALNACGGGDGRVTRAPVGAPAASPPQGNTSSNSAGELQREVARLERDGVIPILDRGTDVPGPDTNGNGVRDDIDAYIAALPVTEIQRRAALQMARVKQSQLMLDPAHRRSVLAASERSVAAHNCMATVFEGSSRKGYAADLGSRIEAITANTPERTTRYLRYMAALSGTSVDYPDGNTCEP